MSLIIPIDYDQHKFDYNSEIIRIYIPYFVALIAIVVSGIRLFTRDLYGDTGYLIYTLPKKASFLNGAKIVEIIIEMFIVSGISSVFMISKCNTILLLDERLIGKYDNFVLFFLTFYIAHIVAALLFLMLVCFAESLGKVAYPIKRASDV